jgi:hypothetical protein
MGLYILSLLFFILVMSQEGKKERKERKKVMTLWAESHHRVPDIADLS